MDVLKGRFGWMGSWGRARSRFIDTALGATAMVAMLASSASAGSPRLNQVSGQPYRNGPACQSQGADGEVSLAVDPAHPARLVAAWMQDLVPFGNTTLGNNLVLTASSSDGGLTWSLPAAPPGTSDCAIPPGAALGGVFDPSLSVGPDGRWYLAMTGGQPGPPQVYASTSTDGTQWKSLPALIPGSVGADSPTVVADKVRAGRAYVTWSNLPAMLISVTDDGGQTFSVPAIVRRTPPGLIDDPSRLVELSDGSLLAVFDELSFSEETNGNFEGTLFSTRSVDGGAHWSPPVVIGAQPQSSVIDPGNGTLYAKISGFSLAAGPNKTAEVAWSTTSGASSSDIHIASTRDAGHTWTLVTDMHRQTQAFQASVAVASDGTIATTWYDFSGSQPAGMIRPTELWMAHSTNGGATWSIGPLAGPFDLAGAAASNFAGGYLGDYQALIATNTGFDAGFTLAKPLAHNGPTDIFVAALPDS